MHQSIKIAIERADGGVSIMSFAIAGRGNLLPIGAQWTDEKRGLWSRAPADSAVADEVARAVPDAVGWHRLLDDEVPQDRAFRDALVVNEGKLTHDIERARDIVRKHIRHERARALPDLDAKWMRATGQGNKAEATKIEAERQAWRDAPADPQIDLATTLGQLARIVSKG